MYLEGQDCWSTEVGNAIDFGNSDNAIEFCAKHSITLVHVVLQWSGMPYSIAIPIAAAGHESYGAKPGRVGKHA